MEQFDVARGLIKKITGSGGLVEVMQRHFNDVEGVRISEVDGVNSVLLEEPAYLPNVRVSYSERGLLQVDGEQAKPDFSDNDAVRRAQMSRAAWTSFLDESTGYDGKKRGDKAKERVKRRAKSMSRVNEWNSYIEKVSHIDDDVLEQGQALIEEIESALSDEDITKAFGRSEKLSKLMG